MAGDSNVSRRRGASQAIHPCEAALHWQPPPAVTGDHRQIQGTLSVHVSADRNQPGLAFLGFHADWWRRYKLPSHFDASCDKTQGWPSLYRSLSQGKADLHHMSKSTALNLCPGFSISIPTTRLIPVFFTIMWLLLKSRTEFSWVWCMPLIPALQKQRQRASLVYRLSTSQSVRTTYGTLFKKKIEQILSHIFYKAKSTSTSGVETHPTRTVIFHLWLECQSWYR